MKLASLFFIVLAMIFAMNMNGFFTPPKSPLEDTREGVVIESPNDKKSGLHFNFLKIGYPTSPPVPTVPPIVYPTPTFGPSPTPFPTRPPLPTPTYGPTPTPFPTYPPPPPPTSPPS